MSDTRSQEEVQLAANLRMRLLERFDELMDAGEDTPTDRATLSRLLTGAGGWVLDPSRMPQGLEEKITQRARYDEDPEVG